MDTEERPFNLENFHSSVKRLGKIVSGGFKFFLLMNGIMILIAVYNVVQSKAETFRLSFWIFCILLLNFWMMLTFFFIVSMCVKMCMIISIDPSALENSMSWIQTLVLFPLPSQDSEMDVISAVLRESMETSHPPSRPSPTLDKLLRMDLRWGSVLRVLSLEEYEEIEEKCLICLQGMTHLFPNMPGVASLTCSCATLFHKKCVLEWFYFNEKEATDTEPAVATCPACRHAFTIPDASSRVQ